MNSNINNSLLVNILKLLKKYFSEIFTVNKFGRPRKYQLGNILALLIYQARNSNLSFRKVVNFIKEDCLALKLLDFETIPDFTVIFKNYQKYFKSKMNLYIAKIGNELYKDSDIFYLDSSSLVSTKSDKEAKYGKSTRIDWYKGYKLHLICSKNGIPLSFNITTANIHDSKCENLFKSFKNLEIDPIIFADKGYNSSRLLDLCDSLKIRLICPLNKRNSKKLNPSHVLRARNYTYLLSAEGKKNYKKRWEIERLFSVLKENYNIDNHRIWGLSRKFFNVAFKILLFTIEKTIVLALYFCNTLFYLYLFKILYTFLIL